jgi:hypothetical protein
MSVQSFRAAGAALAIAFLIAATPAAAQDVTFTDIRDAVPQKFFSTSPDITRVIPGAPNTLEIGFESGLSPVDFLENEFRATTEAFGNRVASDTLSFNVVAPDGYYVSSITYQQTGTGSILRVADTRGTSGWVVDGLPASLGVFRTDPSLARTATFTDSRLTVVPVSITTSLFAFAPATSGSATIELTSARVIVTVAPLGTTEPKKSAIIEVSGFTGTYDGAPHGATGTATGVNGEDLSALLTLGDTFTNAPGGTATWTFAGDANYNAAEGTAAITIVPADATIDVSGFTGTYDGFAHGATGTVTGVNNENLNALLNLGATFTDVPGGIANWSFSGGTNYNPASGQATITINKATPVLSWPQPAAVVVGTPLSATQLNATANVEGTFVYSPPLGTVLTETQPLSVVFTPADTTNYNGATATVTITVQPNPGVEIVNPGPQTSKVDEEVRLRIRLTGGSSFERRGEFTAKGLPRGLEMRDEGVIRGEAEKVGTSRVTVTFRYKGGTVSTQFDWTVVRRSKKNDKDKD